ncbi:MAG TPA: rRNA adenine N-6-methyltransferase family protein [Candidatus Deferrimicrobium sp.]|nr:rRNA adenine N-6-methyltransferase family protein [Candidatus Deferrimicrobium sp.]
MPFLMKDQLIKQLKSLKIIPQKAEGQNYLIDFQICSTFVDDAQILSDQEDVLEIGPGLGAFSDLLAKRSRNFILIEKNTESAKFLERHFQAHYATERIESRQIKFLGSISIKTKITIAEGNVLELPLPKVDVIIANLSFKISVEIFIHLIETWQYQRMFFILQKEFVDHLIATAGRAHYTFISVLVSFYFNVEIIRDLPASAFYPKPRINLKVVRFTPKAVLCPGKSEFDHRIEFIKFLKRVMIFKNKCVIKAVKGFLQEREIQLVPEIDISQKLIKVNPDWNIQPLKNLSPSELYSLMEEIQTIRNLL